MKAKCCCQFFSAKKTHFPLPTIDLVCCVSLPSCSQTCCAARFLLSPRRYCLVLTVPVYRQVGGFVHPSRGATRALLQSWSLPHAASRSCWLSHFHVCFFFSFESLGWLLVDATVFFLQIKLFEEAAIRSASCGSFGLQFIFHFATVLGGIYFLFGEAFWAGYCGRFDAFCGRFMHVEGSLLKKMAPNCIFTTYYL